jgi:chromosome segregation ATPase
LGKSRILFCEISIFVDKGITMMHALQTTSFPFQSFPKPSLEGLNLTPEQQGELQFLISEFRSSQNRLANEFVIMSAKLAMMKGILGDKFMPFVEREFQLSARSVKRYLQLHEVMVKRLSTDGRIDVEEVKQFTQGALRMLAPETDEDIINEVRSIAQAGKPVNEEVINQIIAARNTEYEGRLQLAESEAAEAVRKLEAERQRSQIDYAQSKEKMDRLEEINRRAQAQIAALEEDIQTMEKKANQVVEIDKVVPPEGFATIEEAIADAKARLIEAEARQREAEGQAEAAEKIAEGLQQKLTSFHEETRDFIRVKDMVEEVMKSLPQAQLQSLATKDPAVKKALTTMGDALQQFGKSLLTTAAAA